MNRKTMITVYLMGAALLLVQLLTGGAAGAADTETVTATQYSALVADGLADDTAALQWLLDAAAIKGDKVFLPAGKYLVKGSLTIPDGVALEGTAHGSRYNRPLTGTVILATGGREDEEGPALFVMGNSTSVSGLTIYYPEQKATDIRPYPWTFRLWGYDNTVENITFINSYKAIMIGGTEWGVRHRISNVYGCVLRHGVYIDGCSDIGRLENIHFHGHWWWSEQVGGAPDNPDGTLGPVSRFMMDNLEAFTFGKTDWEYVTNTFVYIAKVGYRFIKTDKGAASCQMLGVGADAVRTGVLVEGIDSWFTLLITNGQFTTDGLDPAAVGVQINSNPEPWANGHVRLVNCSILSPQGVISHNPKVTSVQNCLLNAWGPPSPAALIKADNGTLQVNGCNFDSNRVVDGPPATSIELDSPLGYAIISDNVGLHGVKLINNGVPIANVVTRDNQPATF